MKDISFSVQEHVLGKQGKDSQSFDHGALGQPLNPPIDFDLSYQKFKIVNKQYFGYALCSLFLSKVRYQMAPFLSYLYLCKNGTKTT